MKRIIFLEIMNKLRANPKLLRKVKIFVITGVIGFIVTGLLTIWAGISALNYVSSYASQFLQSPTAQNHIENLRAEMKDRPKLQTVSCWNKVQTLISIQPWIEKSALENIAHLKTACFEQKPQKCQDSDCERIKSQTNTAEGSFI